MSANIHSDTWIITDNRIERKKRSYADIVNTFDKDHNKIKALSAEKNNTEDRLDSSFSKSRNKGVLGEFEVFPKENETSNSYKSKSPFKILANISSTSDGGRCDINTFAV